MTLNIGKRSEQSNPDCSTNQTPVDNTEKEPNTEPRDTGYVNQAGPHGTDAIVGNMTSQCVNVPISEISNQSQSSRPNSIATEGIVSSTYYEIPD